MYKNLLDTMSNKKITFTQISELLHCQLRTVSEKSRGVVQSEFTVTEALLIKRVFFPEYDIDWLFEKEELSLNKHTFDKGTIPLSHACVNWERRVREDDISFGLESNVKFDTYKYL